MEPCTEKHRITRLEADVRDLQTADKKHSDDITSLKEGQAESRIYQKMISEQLAEIKAMLTVLQKKAKGDGPDKQWIDLIKWVLGGTIIAIVAWMVASGFGG